MQSNLPSSQSSNIQFDGSSIVVSDSTLDSSSINEAKAFIRYCTSSRDKFVKDFWQLCGNDIEARVMAEDLLIAYDQLLSRYSDVIL